MAGRILEEMATPWGGSPDFRPSVKAEGVTDGRGLYVDYGFE